MKRYYKGTYMGTVEQFPDGSIGVSGQREHFGVHAFGRFMKCDIGKQIHRVGTVLQMENSEQMERRLADIRRAMA